MLDEDGQELATTQTGTLASFTPTNDGTHYVEVSHANEQDWQNAGVYTLTVDLLKEGDDIAAANTTEARLSTGSQISDALSPPGDSDWFKIYAESGQTYHVIAAGDDSNGQTALDEAEMAAYQNNGSQVSGTEFQSDTINGHWVGELQP